MCVWRGCFSFFFLFFFFLLAVLGSGAGRRRALGGQQRRLEGAGSGALARGEHLAGEMVKGVMSFWGGTGPPVRTCRHNTTTTAPAHHSTPQKGESLACFLGS